MIGEMEKHLGKHIVIDRETVSEDDSQGILGKPIVRQQHIKIYKQRNKLVAFIESRKQGITNLHIKMIKFGIKLSSFIPNTDEITLNSGRYYLPTRFKVRIHFMRRSL